LDDAQQLLVWRWSTVIQLSSLAMVSAFFGLLARSNPRPELRWWARAWTANLVALVATSIHWLVQSEALFPLISAVYIGGKTAFALMLAQGAWTMIRPGLLFTRRQLTIGVVTYSIIAPIILREINSVGIVQHSVMGVIFVALAGVLAQSRADGVTWLASGLAIRGLLALAEAAAYIIQRASPYGSFTALLTGGFLPASSSFDMGAEWLVVLGSVLAVSERGRHALEASHQRLVLAQADLRRLADRDPLTGAINRRALRDVFKAVHGSGAMLLFFDLDGFKRINDVHGHAAGDACLQAFAAALKESFRPDDHVIRYGGDEFLVVAPGLDNTTAQSRVEDVTARMARRRGEVVCGFSVGMAALEPEEQPDAALQLADQNMYKAKKRVRP
jgi:diguanylate cyclase (GGDEF)-like protein